MAKCGSDGTAVRPADGAPVDCWVSACGERSDSTVPPIGRRLKWHAVGQLTVREGLAVAHTPPPGLAPGTQLHCDGGGGTGCSEELGPVVQGSWDRKSWRSLSIQTPAGLWRPGADAWHSSPFLVTYKAINVAY